ncbi:hypothetical protein [Actinoplanes palleronii]|uniref:DNA-binding protein n=1 Tax=Actinoplanes palleronii TaxID=113570 RepID=A0ABQ4B5U9_9ACTN|nr:hypothetical protein [Actinoplanes palleronii]GIE66023.1 hypothetical protein Apa02nite_021310 [Actinoplanes palleronii]
MSEALLAAGAILTGPAGEAGLDTVTARSYRHPVLPGRTVVRLVGATLGPAEDLTMEFLGFTAGDPVPVGHARAQALGFPAWALVHDPANGRHALALVKDIEKLARAARSKPGLAVDGYHALADRLGAAAPQFLPTFWEQAGRAFLDAGNPRMAGTCFTEARRAEQVHGLVIDEDRVRDVHLEFAFGGALTAAMLTAYARGVTDRRSAAEAYHLVRSLAVRRVAGGLAPHASMAADLARLAKAAGLDAEAEADAVAGQLLVFPATVRAHPSVWKAYRKSLVRLGKRDAAVRDRLRQLVPEPPGYDTDMTDQWLELLDAAGATGELIPPESPDGTASRWLERFLAGREAGRITGRSARLIALVERMLPRLAAEGGLTIASRPWSAELDLLDLCLAGGVPVRCGEQAGDHLPLESWVSDTGPGRRDLAAIAADPVWRPLLRRSVRIAVRRFRSGDSLTGPALPAETLTVAFGVPGVRELLVEELTEQTARAGQGTVASLDFDLTSLAPLWSPAGMALAPDGFRRLLAVDVPEVVRRTLRAGLPVELSWPAYEAAAKQKLRVSFGDAWPDLVVHDHLSAHVIAPGDRVTEHVFRLPGATYQDVSCRLVDGDLLVAGWNWDGRDAYWSSHPADVFDDDLRVHPVAWGVAALQLPLPGGGVTTGTRPVHPGDRVGPGTAYPLATDGQALWLCEPSPEHGWRWREFDPRTGQYGRISMPTFFTGAPDGHRLVEQVCQLRPAPAEFAGSPLGRRDGLVGWRAEITADGDQAGESVDGRRVTLPQRALRRFDRDSGSSRLSAAVLLPGATVPLPITRTDGHSRGRLQIWTADGEHLLAEQPDGTSTLPPLAWWHGLRARDEAGSAALRELDEATAAALLTVDGAVTGTAQVKAAVAANLAAHLPAVTDEVLRDRIVEVVARAVRLRRRITEIPQHLDAVPAVAGPAPAVADDVLEEAWRGLCGFSHQTHHGYGTGREGRHDILAQVGAVAATLGGDEPVPLRAVEPVWLPLLAGPGAVALRAASPVTGDDGRRALAAFLATVAGTPLDGGAPLRVLYLSHPDKAPPHPNSRHTVLLPGEQQYYGKDQTVTHAGVQLTPFDPPAGMTLTEELRAGGRLAGERLHTFGALLAEHGPAPWRPEAAEALAAATGMTRAEAILLLAGLPGIASWEANFLTAGQRTVLGLTSAHAKVGQAALRELTPPQRVALLDAAMPADPAALWTHGPDVPAVAEVWIRIRGRRTPVPEDLVAELARITDRERAAAVLQAIAGPGPGDWLSTDGRTERGGWSLQTRAATGVPFDEGYLHAAAAALPWLAYGLTWDDPLRAGLPEALRLIRERLRHPHLAVGTGEHEATARPAAGPALVDGCTYGGTVRHHVVPALLSGPDDPVLGLIDDDTASSLRVVLGGWLDRVVAAPAGDGGDPHDPRVAAPELVDAAGARLGVDRAAAAYYLQVLALPDPTDKAVQKWNGWKVATLRKAQTVLTDNGLLVAAKRERAARPVFLPGGWTPARVPRLPVETWKLPLYLHLSGRQFVTLPLPELFAAAWARITAGDVPRYHDLQEKL